MELPLPADGAHAVAGARVLRRLGRRDSPPFLRQQPSRFVDLPAVAAVGEDAILANAFETSRQDVKEEATKKLGPCEAHHTSPAAVPVILPQEGHLPIV